MRESRRSGRLLGLFAAGWLLLNFPLFSIWDRDELVHGWPLLPTAPNGRCAKSASSPNKAKKKPWLWPTGRRCAGLTSLCLSIR